MNNEKILSNKIIPVDIEKRLSSLFNEEDPAIFAIVGDLNPKAKYATSVALFSKSKVVISNGENEDSTACYDFSGIEKVEVKRMYGNAIFKIIDKNGKKIDAMRFTYSVADIADAAADYINRMNENESSDELFEMISASYRKMRSFCPKCGRKISSPDADCINCNSKGKIFSSLLVYVRPHGKSLVWCTLLSLITTAMALAPPYITKVVVDDVIPNKNVRQLIVVTSVLLGVYILQHVLGAFRSYYLRRIGDKIIIDLKKDIYKKAQYLPMSFYDKTSTGSVINRINGDTQVLQNFMLRITQEAVVQLFMLIGIVVIMFAMHWQLSLLSLTPIPIIIICTRIFGKKISPMYHRIWRRNTTLSNILTDNIPGVRVIKSFAAEKRSVKKFGVHADDWLDESKNAARISSIFPNVVTFLITSGSLIIWIVGGMWSMDPAGKLSIGLLVSFISYTSMFYNPVNFFANLNDTFQNALASAEKIFDIIDAEPEHNFGKGNTLSRVDGKIEFKSVNFSFDRSKKVIDNVSFTINPGDIVGVVGTTGSGKSTLINLLMRFYDNYEGEIFVDDNNIKDIDMEFFRSQIGYVQQEPMMFRDTIFNNIAYSDPGAHAEQIINAADVANAHGFISRLPDAYDTMLGERGVGLSGGEKQRLSIARAVLKNPSILIFDEATAAVDTETEHLIQEAIERLISGRTTIMIAHRLSTLRRANRILVVDKGRIIENGSPEELMELKGKFYKLIQIQSMTDQVKQQKEEENFE